MRHEPLVDVQGHFPVARPGHVCGELREDGVFTQDEAHRLQRAGIVDEGAEDLALVGQEGHPLVDVVVRLDREISRAMSVATLGCALLEDSLSNPCSRLRVERALEHCESMLAQVRPEPVHLAREPRSARHRTTMSLRRRANRLARFPPRLACAVGVRGSGAWR